MTEINSILEFNKDGDIGILTIKLPPQNFIPEPDFADINILKNLFDAENLKGLIICGAGRHFSAGADLKKLYTLASNNDELLSKITKGKELLDFINNLNIPVIAAIKGSCFGAGLEIALSCHIRVCNQNALFAFPEINHHLMPGLSGTVRLPNISGFSNSIKIMLSGDIIDAETARKIHLADDVTKEKDVTAFALQLLKKMTDHRLPEVIRSIMESLNNSRKMSYNEALTEETRLFCKLAVAEAKRNQQK